MRHITHGSPVANAGRFRFRFHDTRSIIFKEKNTKERTHLAALDPDAAAPELEQELASRREIPAAVLAAVLPHAVVDRLVGVRVRARPGLLSPLCGIA